VSKAFLDFLPFIVTTFFIFLRHLRYIFLSERVKCEKEITKKCDKDFVTLWYHVPVNTFIRSL